MTATAGTPFRLGSALPRSLGIFLRHLPWFLFLAVVGAIPSAYFEHRAAVDAYDRSKEVGNFWGWLYADAWFVPYVTAVVGMLVQSAVVVTTFRALGNAGPEYGRSVGVAFRRFWGVLGASLLIWLISLAVSIGIWMLFRATGTRDPTLYAVTFVLAVSPVSSVYFVTVQAVVVETLGPVRAMSRSAALTRGQRVRILGLVLLLAVVAAAPRHLAPRIVPVPATRGAALTAVWIPIGLDAITWMLVAVVSSVVYHDLRRAKEGTSVEVLLNVFA